MTVQTNTNVASFNGDGANKVFPIGYKFNSAADLVVLLVDDVAVTTRILTLNSDFTVTGAGDDEGGTVTLEVAPTANQRLTIIRIVDILQLTDLRNQGKFYAEIHEDAFDLLTMIAQQHQSDIALSLRVAETDPEPARIPSVAQRAGKLLAFDAAGNPTTALPVADSSTELRQELASTGGAALVGYKEDTVAGYLSKLDATRVPLSRFGLVGDDSDETALFKTALDFVNGTGATLVGDAGKIYRLTDFVQLTDANLDMNNSTIRFAHTGNKCNLQVKGRASVKNVLLIQSGSPVGELGLAGQRLLFALDVHDCEFHNIRFSCGSFGHAPFNIIGNCYNVDVSNISFDTGPWAMGLIIHWATVADSAAVDYATDITYAAGASNATTHPRNITVDNVTGGAFNGTGTLVALLYLSGAYNVEASNLYADQIAKIVTVQAGDYGSDFAPTKEKKLITNGIVINNPVCPDITSTQGVSISGQGMYAASRLRCDVTINNPELDTSLTGTRYGVFIDNCSGAKIVGGTIEGFSTNVFFQRNVTGGLLDSVRITRATGAGIVLDSDQDKIRGVTIRGCEIYGNNTSAVELPNNSGIRLVNTVQAKIISNRFGRPSTTETQRHSVYVNAGCDNISLIDNHTFASAETSAYHADATGGQFSMELWDINNTADTAFSTRPDGHVWSQPIGFGLRRTMLNTPSAVPTTGTHKQGDEVIFRNATAGGHTGARCTVGGTPGTWKTFGAISA